LPNVPRYGAAGQVPVTSDKIDVGPHEEADVQPSHGADNGIDVNFWYGAKFTNDDDGTGKTGMKKSHPSFGGV
jgi:hypothetical protein